MPQNQRESDGTDERGESRADDQRADNRESGEQWFANTAVRLGLTLVGFVLLLFALGQAFGLPLLDTIGDALTTQTGAWLVVAFFAILLIFGAQRGISDA